MTRVLLDASHDTLDKVYDALQRQLALPRHFGRNLDALWDALTTDVPGPVTIEWRDPARAALGDNYDRLVETLRDVAAERSDFRLVIGKPSSGRP
jgi:ribonuclease inhibitor